MMHRIKPFSATYRYAQRQIIHVVLSYREFIHEHFSSLWLLALYFTSGGAIAWLISRISFHTAQQMFSLVEPAYQTGSPYYNRPLVEFTAAVVSAAGALGAYWLANQLPSLKAFLSGIRWPDGLPLATVQLVIACITPSWSSAVMFIGSAFVLISLSISAHFDGQAPEGKSTTSWLVSRVLSTRTIISLLAIAIAAVGLFAWYPVVLPNDYYEIDQTVRLPSLQSTAMETTISRTDFIKFSVAPQLLFTRFLNEPTPRIAEILALRDAYPEEFSRFLKANGRAPNTNSQDPRQSETLTFCRNSNQAADLCRFYLSDVQLEPSPRANSKPDLWTNSRSLFTFGKASPSYFLLLVNAGKWKVKDASSGTEGPLVCEVNARTNPKCNFITSSQIDIDWPSIENAMFHNEQWIAQAGRLLFHHSYLFVPAVHILKYGFDGNVPFLYGVGNTLFHAGLLKLTQPTLQNYFNTFPIAQYLGLALVAVLVFSITRSSLAAICAFAAAATAMYAISAETIFLAPGFSPLRYAGLCLQIATVFLLLRNNSGFRLATLPASFVLSFVWNTEFAYVGLVGQMLALAAPSLKLGQRLRLCCIASLLIVPLACWFVARTNSTDIIANIQVGFFGIGLPSLPKSYYAAFLIISGVSAAAMVYGALKFPAPERDARLAMTPVILLVAIKFLFNPAPPHLFFAMVMILPMSLIYIRWLTPTERAASLSASRMILQDMFAVLIAASSLSFSGPVYKAEKQLFNDYHVNYFKKYDWSSLGDPIETAMPPDPFKERIETIRAKLNADDTVLLLSPFDHLLSFYTNPRRYCGHFELLTNLVFKKDLERVIDCAKNHPNLLVVYDTAVEILCPNRRFFSNYDEHGCEGKKKLKDSLQTIMLTLRPAASDISTVGSLTLFRLDPEKLAKISAKDVDRNKGKFPLYEED